MERLTYKIAPEVVTYDAVDGSNFQEIINKLGAYESTGLTPEEIMDGKLLTGWISVEEKLPEHNTYVICTNEETVRELFYSCGCFYSGMDDQTREVTHWMPLPQPPKGEE